MKAKVRVNRVRYVLIKPCWVLVTMEIRGMLMEAVVFGPVSSSQLWSIAWVEMF